MIPGPGLSLFSPKLHDVKVLLHSSDRTKSVDETPSTGVRRSSGLGGRSVSTTAKPALPPRTHQADLEAAKVSRARIPSFIDKPMS